MTAWLIIVYILAGKPALHTEVLPEPEACQAMVELRAKELEARAATVILEASGCLFVKDGEKI